MKLSMHSAYRLAARLTPRPPRFGWLLLVALSALVQSDAQVRSQDWLRIEQYELVTERVVARNVRELTYRARLTNRGVSIKAATATATSAKPTITIIDGALRFGPVAGGASALSTDTFSFQQNAHGPIRLSDIRWTVTAASNLPPVANAGPDQTGTLSGIVTLNGAGSTDGDGDPLTYVWSFQSRPTGSAASLSDPLSVSPTFTIDVPGSYVLRLVVSDGIATSEPDTVIISTRNSIPVADAGPDQTATLAQLVTLDGSRSSDADGDTLRFVWTVVSKPAASVAVLSNRDSVRPTFVVDVPGRYVIQLVVSDGFAESLPDSVVISTGNTVPVANAGPDRTARILETVILDGSGSTDVDGDQLTYAWSLISAPTGSLAQLSDTSAVRPTIVIDKPGLYIAQLFVNDGTSASQPDTISITTVNSPPVAQAGADQTVVAGQLVTVDGSQSADVEGDPLGYRWSIIAKPSESVATLSNATAAIASFVVDRPGTYVAQLIVNDGAVDSAPDSVTITTTNSAPSASAGPDQIGVPIGQLVTLDGSLSSDPDGHLLTYSWSLIAVPTGSTAALSNAAAANSAFTPDVAGDYVAQLIVHDGFVASDPDTVLIRTGGATAPPTISAHALPLPNAAGWNNTSVTVSFVCQNAVSCPVPITVDTEGEAQGVTGTALGAGGTSASTTVSVSIDKTPPALAIASPQDGALVDATSISVTGTATDGLSGLAAVTCGASPAVVQGGTFDCSVTLNDGVNAIAVAATDAAGNVTSAQVNVTLTSGEAVLRLNEVVLDPLPGHAGFVEIKNAGSGAALLSDFSLKNELANVFHFPALILPSNAIALVLFDGENRVDGLAIHANASAFLGVSQGFVELNAGATSIDRVAWGADQPNAVSQRGSGFAPNPVPGSSLGRSRSSIAVDPLEWDVFSPDQVTPGAPNPNPPVRNLFPLNGAIMAPGSVRLDWYPSLGATHYRVQIASDESFSLPIVDQTTTDSSLSTTVLPDGRYFWRVQAAGGGVLADYSAPSRLIVRSTTPALAEAIEHLPARGPAVALEDIAKELAVPSISQHKDTKLLLLESPTESGQHSWNVDHRVLDVSDPADRVNCMAAAIAMVNHFLGGNLSQDRIRYEVFHTPGGPENDFGYGQTFGPAEVDKALTYAFGAAAGGHFAGPSSLENFWTVVSQAIDLGRPVIGAQIGQTGHAFVISGYEQDADGRRIWVRDPWNPSSAEARIYLVPIENGVSDVLAAGGSYLLWLPGANAVSEEPEMSMDVDSDGVLDFDETRRFHTDPDDRDTDNDKIGDLQEIRASKFDQKFPYTNGMAARVDADSDGLPMERDRDSDGDGCPDGTEDFNLNGVFEPALGETHNFEKDTKCAPWSGTAISDLQYKSFPNTHIRTRADVTWSPDDSFPFGLGGLQLFRPTGNAVVTLFEANGCVATVIPNNIAIQPADGQLGIDTTQIPNVASGYGSTAITGDVIDCEGQSQLVPILIPFFSNEPLPLNPEGNEIAATIVVYEDEVSRLTLDIHYTRIR